MRDQEDQLFDQDDQDKKGEHNVKKPPPTKNLNQEQKSKKNQSNEAFRDNQDQQTQFDVEGSDILYQLSQKLKQRQQQ